jgi:hypothetical protein
MVSWFTYDEPLEPLPPDVQREFERRWDRYVRALEWRDLVDEALAGVRAALRKSGAA